MIFVRVEKLGFSNLLKSFNSTRLLLGSAILNLSIIMARIIKFEKNDCAPCAQVSAYLDQKGIKYESINPFDQPDLAAKFKVRTVPTVIVLENDEIQHRIIGFKPEELGAIAL